MLAQPCNSLERARDRGHTIPMRNILSTAAAYAFFALLAVGAGGVYYAAAGYAAH